MIGSINALMNATEFRAQSDGVSEPHRARYLFRFLGEYQLSIKE